MTTADLGTPIIIESTLQKYTPFGSYANSDPDTPPTITVVDKKGNIRVDDVAMTKNVTGEYYYTIQTLSTWLKGIYNVEINAAFSPNTDVHIEKRSFMLE